MTATAELVGIVDDDESVRRSLRRLFKSAGYAAETFASAENYLRREVFAGPTCLGHLASGGTEPKRFSWIAIFASRD